MYIVMHCGRRGDRSHPACYANREGRAISTETVFAHVRRPAAGLAAARWLPAVVSVMWAALPAAAQRGPLALPLHDPAYVLLDGLESSGCAPARISAYRPFVVQRVIAAIRLAKTDPACAPSLVAVLEARFDPTVDSVSLPTTMVTPARVGPSRAINDEVSIGAAVTVRGTAIGKGEFRPLASDLRPKADGDPPAVALLRARGRYSPTPRTVAVIEAFGQSHVRNDPLIRSGRLRSTTGAVGITEATFTGAAGPLMLSIGRDREVWLGRGTESLVLSGNAPPLDRLMAALDTRHFEGRALYAMLDDVVLDDVRGELPTGTPAQRFHRSLVAHSLTWRPSRAFELTAGETVLLSRGSRTLELGYANPLMPYILTQNDGSGNQTRDNLGVFISARGRLGRSLLSAELLVDDVQIDADRELTPNQLAWRVEGRQGWAAPIPGALAIEYERVDSYTYLRGLYTDVYQFADRPLGSELGPDADRITGSAEVWPTGTLRLSSSVGVWRRGAQRLSKRPAEGAVGNAGQSFPTVSADRPYAQRALLADVTATVAHWDFPVMVRVEAARIQNPGNTTPARSIYIRAHLSATYAFRYP